NRLLLPLVSNKPTPKNRCPREKERTSPRVCNSTVKRAKGACHVAADAPVHAAVARRRRLCWRREVPGESQRPRNHGTGGSVPSGASCSVLAIISSPHTRVRGRSIA